MSRYQEQQLKKNIEGLKCRRYQLVRLPVKDDSNSHGARPVHQIISMIKWIRTSKLSIHDSLSVSRYQQEQLRKHVEEREGASNI